MHELSIAQGVLDAAAEESARRGGVRVAAIHLRIGALSGVVPEALRSAFELAREASDLSRAELVIEEVPVTVYCPACAGERAVGSSRQLCCPDCGTPTPQLVRGRELEVSALEIES